MLEIVYKTTAELTPYANNSRTHSAAQVAQVAASITEFGFTNPVLIDDDGSIIAGHGRVQAAKKLALDEIPTITLPGLTADQKRAYVIADNQLALNAGWDLDLLKIEINNLVDADFDLDILGFDEEFLAGLTDEEQTEGLTDEDDVPEVPAIPATVLGDVWVLGNHRLMCGDSTSIDEVDTLMDGGIADMVWTDPPYNVAYQGGTTDKLTIQNDDMGDSHFREFLRDVFSAAAMATKPGGPIYIAHAPTEAHNFINGMVEAGWLLKQCLVWVKNYMVLGHQDYQWQHESILYGWKSGAAHCWYGDFDKKTVIDDDVKANALSKRELVGIVNEFRNAKNTTVVREDKPHRSDIHPTMKPVALVNGLINNSSREKDIVLDLFGGGGSTLIACEKSARHCRMMELDPKYVDVIIKRWQAFTGKQATHIDGQLFDEVTDD